MRKFMKVSLAAGAGAFTLGLIGLQAATAADMSYPEGGSIKGRRPRLTDRHPKHTDHHPKHTGRRRPKRVMVFRRHRRHPSATLFRRRLPPITGRLMWSCRDLITGADHTGVVIRRITRMGYGHRGGCRPDDRLPQGQYPETGHIRAGN